MELLNEKELAHVIGGKRKCPNLLVDAKIAVFSELQGDLEPADYFKHHAFA
ncbi:bacteriocin [Lacticaseibacillus paracasei]|uniref:bacteriocin n=1 Tax=Lacticaseibacillus paracasei TaxID=1597 RepID=UPI0031CE0087